VERVLALTLETTPSDATHWSTRSLAKRTGLSRASIHRIWRVFSLAPQRSETFKLSKDPLLNLVDRLCSDRYKVDYIPRIAASILFMNLQQKKQSPPVLSGFA
jgi:hypothetical protein